MMGSELDYVFALLAVIVLVFGNMFVYDAGCDQLVSSAKDRGATLQWVFYGSIVIITLAFDLVTVVRLFIWMLL